MNAMCLCVHVEAQCAAVGQRLQSHLVTPTFPPPTSFHSFKIIGVLYTIGQPLKKLCDLGVEVVQGLGELHLP